MHYSLYIVSTPKLKIEYPMRSPKPCLHSHFRHIILSHTQPSGFAYSYNCLYMSKNKVHSTSIFVPKNSRK